MALTYEAMKDRLARAGDINQENNLLTTEFNSLISDMRRQDTDKNQKDLEGLFRLNRLEQAQAGCRGACNPV